MKQTQGPGTPVGEGPSQASTSSEGPGRRGRGCRTRGTAAVLQAQALIDVEDAEHASFPTK